jgi:hypothetical protein
MKQKLFPVMDRVSKEEYVKFGLKGTQGIPYPPIGRPAKGVKARWTGEKRCPKAGEWYLSGAEVEAYKAPSDLSEVYHIAELVKDHV